VPFGSKIGAEQEDARQQIFERQSGHWWWVDRARCGLGRWNQRLPFTPSASRGVACPGPSMGTAFTDGISMMDLREAFQALCMIHESERSCRAASDSISRSISSGK
jgi:hypothetical protein